MRAAWRKSRSISRTGTYAATGAPSCRPMTADVRWQISRSFSHRVTSNSEPEGESNLTLLDAAPQPCDGCPAEPFRGDAQIEDEELPFRVSAAFRLQLAQDVLPGEPVQPEPEGLAARKPQVLRVQTGNVPALPPSHCVAPRQ